MKRLIATGIFIFLISCKQKEVTTEYLIDSTIEIYKKELPKNIIFFKGKGNINVKDTKNFILLDAKGLLKRNDENFLC